MGPQCPSQSCCISTGCPARKWQLTPFFISLALMPFPILTVSMEDPDSHSTGRVESARRVPPVCLSAYCPPLHSPPCTCLPACCYDDLSSHWPCHLCPSAPSSHSRTHSSCSPLSSLRHRVFILHWIHISSKMLLFSHSRTFSPSLHSIP